MGQVDAQELTCVHYAARAGHADVVDAVLVAEGEPEEGDEPDDRCGSRAYACAGLIMSVPCATAAQAPLAQAGATAV